MKKTLLFLSILLVFITCKTNTKQENQYEEEIEVRDKEIIANTNNKISSTAEAIALANGFKNWGKVKEIKYTFNIDKDSSHYERSWKWQPKNNRVTLISNQDTITYNRTHIDNTSLKTDQRFVNDKYWLFAPFNLVWDEENFTSKHQIKAIAPISNTEMQKLTIVYKNEGGYTPGDAYDFYFKGDFIIREWVFRQRNQEQPSITTSWEDYQDFNGIKIAKTRKQNEEDRILYFTNIEVITE